MYVLRLAFHYGLIWVNLCLCHRDVRPHANVTYPSWDFFARVTFTLLVYVHLAGLVTSAILLGVFTLCTAHYFRPYILRRYSH